MRVFAELTGQHLPSPQEAAEAAAGFVFQASNFGYEDTYLVFNRAPTLLAICESGCAIQKPDFIFET